MMNWAGLAKDTRGASDGGVVVTVSSRDMLLDDLGARLAAGRGFSVATLNLDHVTKLRALPAFRQAYQSHTHVTADGNPIVWLSRLAGQEVALVPGSELITPVAELAAQNDVPVAFFGATQASLQAAADALQLHIPDLKIATIIAPPMGFDPTGPDAQPYIDALKTSGAGVCFLALGAPKQEIFAMRASEQIPSMGFLSIGAGLDFISGRQVRAPKIMRRFAGEWIWRLAGNPRRLGGRYAACIAILPSLINQAVKTRLQVSRGDVL
jgi:N-acetylglucosaminyldiphosphoundecaprenol N-acetyl-beta-D-mannosaminyltransferase